jgi:hypothetical protein
MLYRDRSRLDNRMREQNEHIAESMAKKCLFSWQNRAVFGEEDFEEHRERLGDFLVSLTYEYGEFWYLAIPGVYQVIKIRTQKDKEVQAKIEKGCDYANEMIEKGDLVRARKALEKVERIKEWFHRWN